jgi:hypothetical protein
VQLNDKLGTLNRVQGGLFSGIVDKSPMDMCFQTKYLSLPSSHTHN